MANLCSVEARAGLFSLLKKSLWTRTAKELEKKLRAVQKHCCIALLLLDLAVLGKQSFFRVFLGVSYFTDRGQCFVKPGVFGGLDLRQCCAELVG